MVDLFGKTTFALNHSPLARGSVRIHGSRLYGFTFDRLLYLWLHRVGLMGRSGVQLIRTRVREGMTVLDVGANVGVYTSLLSRIVGPHGHVLALEPDPDNWRALQKASTANGWQNVELHQTAAADRKGQMSFARSSFNSGNHSLQSDPSRPGAEVVNVIRLDELLEGRKINFIKIDVQGWEASVLRGAEKVLREKSPLSMLVELWPQGLQRNGSSAGEVLELLESFSFRLLDPADGRPFGAPPTRGYQDVLAVRH
jgi:FkbM family methyltransferase